MGRPTGVPLPRPADQIFLKLAVTQGALSREDADDVWSELCRLEEEGAPSKARVLCLELGFIDDALGKKLKEEVRVYLERKEREVQADSKLDRRIAGFELLERLGSGAMGVVFKARHLGLNKLVALKVLNPDFAADERYVQRFTLEARVAAELNHPAIVQANDVGKAGDVHYIAMEFVDGKTVKELIERRTRLDEQAAVEIVLQVLDGLKHAHSRSLIHRDIKPANIMITRDGKAKILDLGLAKRTDVENGLTGEGRAIGTPYFMAPEQALDKGADYRSDIYSLGATLFNMVVGDKPYVASTPVAVMNMHLKAPVPDAHALVPSVSEGLAKVVKKMLAKRPADRYQSHEALKADLEAVLSGLMPELDGGRPPEGIDVIASRPQGKTRAQRAAEEEKGKAPLLVGAAAVVCLVFGIGFMVHARRTPPKPDVPDLPQGPTDDGQAQREELARVALEALLKRPKTEAPPSRELAEELIQVANQYQGTAAGSDAYARAQQVLKDQEGDEARRFLERKAELEGLARDGKLREAAQGWQELARAVEAAERKAQAEARASELEKQVEALIAKARADADEQAAAGREDQAARALRRSLPHLPEGDRELVLVRVQELEAQWTRRQVEARRRTEEETQRAAAEELKLVDQLVPRLREAVKAGKAAEAKAEVGAAITTLRSAELIERLRLHEAALAAIAGLVDLGRDSFARLKEGETLALKKRNGTSYEGKIGGVSEGKLVLKKAAGAEWLFSPEDLDEDSLHRVIRKAFGAGHGPYHHGVGALKLYRGDADADEAVARAQKEAGIDLAALRAELAPKAAAQPGQGSSDQPGNPVAVGPNPGGNGPNPQADPAEEKRRRRAELNGRMIAQSSRLFGESEKIGVYELRVGVPWDFTKLKSFGPHDWRLTEGKASPTPPGQMQRLGLRLASGDGRAELCCPVEGDFTLEARMMFPSGMAKGGRFALVADGLDGKRVACELGQLVVREKSRVRGTNGQPQTAQIRGGGTAIDSMELRREGKRWVARWNGGVVAELALDETPGDLRLALEWSHPVDLLGLQLEATPTEGWLEKRLDELERR